MRTTLRVAACVMVGWVHAGSAIAAEKLTVPPVSAAAALPAVVIVTSSPGFDGRSAFYAEALQAAGFATLVTDIADTGRAVKAYLP